MYLHDLLIVIDMQNDFVSGSLGTLNAQKIVPNVVAKVKRYEDAGKPVYFTKDTHYDSYLDTFEGHRIPVKHCVSNTWGWELVEPLKPKDYEHVIPKMQFGYPNWLFRLANQDVGSIEICGLCTDICVVSNALILRTLYPHAIISLDTNCCAGATVDNHKAALKVMSANMIDVYE